jgi:hypothetical protein
MKTNHLVPLGENVTRDGRKARVICNDREGANPVIALIKRDSAPEVTSHHFADGTVNISGTEHPSDLVGHLPQKSREWDVTVTKCPVSKNQYLWDPRCASASNPEKIRVREVLPGEDDELEKLEAAIKPVLAACHGLRDTDDWRGVAVILVRCHALMDTHPELFPENASMEAREKQS